MINYEIKSQLAKLLATEDLVVENQNVDTACFDVETRVLTLPMWEKASNVVYDMLVGHEVGHALFTPDEWDFVGKIPKSYVNVTEDARIERLMKRKYPGLSKSFYRGYQELSEQDFFMIGDQDISKMSLPDRVNLYYKIGSFVKVPFTDEEMKIVELVGSSETFADALAAAEEMFRFVGDSIEHKPQPTLNNETDGGGEQVDEETKDELPTESSEDLEESDQEEQPEEVSDETTQDPFEVQTDETFTDGAQSLTDTSRSRRSEYYEVPKLDIDDLINSNSDVHNLISEFFTASDQDSFYRVDKRYNEFKKTAQREVNYLVKEFECKKAADTYARITTSRTGVLDCSKLHTYKYNDDLFKKVNVVPDGKNHGLIFILDWSGSMHHCMEDTIKQMYNLVWFCSKVNIPFEVYAFTNSYQRWTQENYRNTLNTPVYGDLAISSDFSLMNLLTSKVNKKNLDVQMRNIFRLVYEMNHYVSYMVPQQTRLSGTPLNEALVSLHTILPRFKKENQLQKVQCVVLTDGEAHQLHHFDYYNDHYTGERKLSPRSFSSQSYIRNRKTGFTYEIGFHYWDFTDILLKDLKQSFPETNFIGIRLCNSRDFASFIRRYSWVTEQETKKARKDKSYTIKGSGYDSYFAMLQSSLSTDSSFNIDEGESKARIKSAFMKSLKAKTLNKKVLSQFMDLVC